MSDTPAECDRLTVQATFCDNLTDHPQRAKLSTLYTIAPPLFDFKSATEVEASTLIDAIILLRYIEIYGELHRGIAVLKMRGSDHDKRIRELQIGSTGSQRRLDIQSPRHGQATFGRWNRRL